MKAWILPKLGSIDALNFAEVPEPTAGDGEVVIRVKLAALNPADRYLAEGMYPARPAMPHILGRDGLGVVDSVGPGVTNWNVGDTAVLIRSEVGVNRPGAFAEKVAVPAESLASVPEGWTDEQASCAALVYITAWQALTQFGELPKGSLVLITGASGGVGIASLHVARSLGLVPIALSRGTSKIDALKENGAELVLDPADPKWTKAIKTQFGDRRVDLAIDNIGGDLFNDVLRTLGENGRVSCVGRLAGPVPQFNTADLFFRRLQIRGVSIGSYTAAESAAVFADLVARLNAVGIRPVVDRVFGFRELPAAFERLHAGPLGKIILRVGQ
ncbi:MAG: zinc-binding alcohol dehydrogenase family protein [Tepidisphaeraceae bacterium]